MALLFHSVSKCSHSKDIVDFINKEPQLQSIVRLHDVGIHGVPYQYRQYIKSVPTIITNKNQILVGKEAHNWLASLIPPPELTNCNLNNGFCSIMSCLDESQNDDGFFSLDQYGQSLQPVITPEIQAKINKKL